MVAPRTITLSLRLLARLPRTLPNPRSSRSKPGPVIGAGSSVFRGGAALDLRLERALDTWQLLDQHCYNGIAFLNRNVDTARLGTTAELDNYDFRSWQNYQTASLPVFVRGV